MAINLMQGLLSAVLLQSRKLPGNTVVAGAALSALTPGPIGLLLPLAIARPPATPDDTPDETPGDVTTLVQVPPLVGQTEAEAVQALKKLRLEPEVRLGKVEGGTQPAGQVVAQSPQPDVALAEGSIVVLFVQPPADGGPGTCPPTTAP